MDAMEPKSQEHVRTCSSLLKGTWQRAAIQCFGGIGGLTASSLSRMDS